VMVRLESIGETGSCSVCEIVGQRSEAVLSARGEMGVAMSGTASWDMKDVLRNGAVRRRTLRTRPPLALSQEG
jgi:hypothetical protein